MDRRLRLWSGLAAMALLPTTGSAQPQARPGATICTVTINSSDEGDALRSMFGEATFVELTDFASSDPAQKTDWLPRACRAGVQCDVLLISGHFANKFFGDTRFELPLRTLEQQACQAGCAGVLDRPRLVFLFGCNTLATKRPDARSPRQYRNILIEDGLDPDLADRVVALRYGPLGDDTRARVRKVFPRDTLIFGFSSVGPVGDVAGPHFRRFLAKARRPLARSLESNSLDQRGRRQLKREWMGSFDRLNPAVVDGGPRLSVEECRFRDSRSPRIERLRIAEQLLIEAPLENALLVYDFLVEQSAWSDEEKAILARIERNRAAADDVLAALRHLTGSPGLYLSMLDFVRLVGWIGETEFRTLQDQRMQAILSHRVTEEERDLLCARGLPYDPPEAVFASNRGSVTFMRALPCLSAASPHVREFLVDSLAHQSDAVRLAALEGLTQLGLLAPGDIGRLREIHDTAEPELRAAALWALASADGRNVEVQRFIAAAAVDPDADVAFASGQVVLHLRSTDPETLTALAAALAHESGFVRRSVALVFESLMPTDARVLDALRPYRFDKDPVVKRAMQTVFQNAREDDGRDGFPL